MARLKTTASSSHGEWEIFYVRRHYERCGHVEFVHRLRRVKTLEK
jgi:hypothetical protein